MFEIRRYLYENGYSDAYGKELQIGTRRICEVILCKDCKYWKPSISHYVINGEQVPAATFCKRTEHSVSMDEYDFCSKGEKWGDGQA